jgi:hypothetical protein
MLPYDLGGGSMVPCMSLQTDIWTHDPDGALLQIVDANWAGAKVWQTLTPITPLDVKRHE